MRVVVGLGALCGLPLALWFSRSSRPGVVNALGAVVYGVTLFPLVLMHSVIPAAALYFLTGIIWGPYAAVEATAIQRWVPADQLGRVFGVQRALSITAIPVGGAVGSIALNYASASAVTGASAIACSVIGLLALAFRPLRRRPDSHRLSGDAESRDTRPAAEGGARWLHAREVPMVDVEGPGSRST